jgi:peptidoglycan L-alanyl-D-glutamate endopeptidase CwlK
MTFEFGEKSEAELVGVQPMLVEVVRRALSICPVDFGVHDGIRTEAEQRALFNAGASRTMESRHLTGHAVDLVPYINGKMRWEWAPIYAIAEAVRTAARALKVPLVWGGCWDRNFTDSDEAPADMVRNYTTRQRAKRRDAFTDGPHYELPRNLYP